MSREDQLASFDSGAAHELKRSPQAESNSALRAA